MTLPPHWHRIPNATSIYPLFVHQAKGPVDRSLEVTEQGQSKVFVGTLVVKNPDFKQDITSPRCVELLMASCEHHVPCPGPATAQDVSELYVGGNHRCSRLDAHVTLNHAVDCYGLVRGDCCPACQPLRTDLKRTSRNRSRSTSAKKGLKPSDLSVRTLNSLRQQCVELRQRLEESRSIFGLPLNTKELSGLPPNLIVDLAKISLKHKNDPTKYTNFCDLASICTLTAQELIVSYKNKGCRSHQSEPSVATRAICPEIVE